MTEEKFVVWQTLLEQITINASQYLLSEVCKANTLKEKVKICYENPSIHSTLEKWLSSCISRPLGHKNVDFSVKYRESGNSHCRKKSNLSALRFYNKALFYASKNSEELKSAYANRSHVLLQLNRLEESIEDVNRAVDLTKLDERNTNLLLRKCQAFIALKKIKDAKELISDISSYKESLPDNIQKKIVQTSLEIEKLLELDQNNIKISSKEHTPECPCIDFIENPNFSYASESVSLKKSNFKGRYVVANNNISVGEIIFAEQPFAFVILPDMIDKYCSFCCRRIFAPVPCDYCSLASFCNEKCRDDAYKSFHSWECGGLEVCYSIGIVHLSLRVALLGLIQDKAKRYMEVKSLVSHLNDLQPPDLFSYTITATLLTIYLENYTELFKNDLSKDKLFHFGGTILLHIGQLVCNGHAITDMETVESNSDKSLLIEDQVRVATAIYPSASMMNHSCKPNIINSFFNTLLIVRATDNIEKGNEIYNCYGPMVFNTEFNKRQELLLSQYFFLCNCGPCSRKEGPISDKFFCQKCSKQIYLDSKSCENCLTTINVIKLLDDLKDSDLAFKEGVSKLEASQFNESIPLLLKALKLRELHCHENHRKLFECRDSLAKCFAMLGCEEDAFLYLEKNIRAIECVYGKISIELGQEIMKLLTVATSLRDRNENLSLNQRKILKKSVKYGKKGLLIFKMSYGHWHPRFHEMERHLKYLQAVSNEDVAENIF